MVSASCLGAGLGAALGTDVATAFGAALGAALAAGALVAGRFGWVGRGSGRRTGHDDRRARAESKTEEIASI